jgi:XTP/dITP diphosphohydrolase
MRMIPKKIVLASGNPGKLREFAVLLANRDIEVLPQTAFNIPAAEETGLSFVENAILKARHAAQHSGLPALADDSGIEVDALNGAPGIYSARYAGINASDEDNNRKLLDTLTGVPDSERSARFRCLIAFLMHPDDPTPLICQGSWEGFIAHKARGINGFGYDSIFLPIGHQCTSAELDSTEKNRISHRGQAMRAFYANFFA